MLPRFPHVCTQVALNAIVICWVSANSYVPADANARTDQFSVPTLNVGPLITKVGSKGSSHETKQVQTNPGGGEAFAETGVEASPPYVEDVGG